MKVFPLCAVVLSSFFSWAETPDWPANYDAELSAHLAAITPQGTQVALSQEIRVTATDNVQAELSGFGSDAEPFDSIYCLVQVVGPIKFNSFPTVGFLLFLK